MQGLWDEPVLSLAFPTRHSSKSLRELGWKIHCETKYDRPRLALRINASRVARIH